MHSKATLAALGLLLLALVAASSPRRVGDGHEYMAMAMNMAALRAPAIGAAEVGGVEADLARWNFTGLPLNRHAELRDAAGRQDFFHFWLYSALAVPGLWAVRLVGAHPNYGFVLLNALLFLGAAWAVCRKLGWWGTAAVFCSPVLWWVDKSHTETFTFSLLAAAFAFLGDAPWWSMVALGAASAQNPPVGVVFAAVAVSVLATESGRRDRRVWLGAAAGLVTALAHPVYYFARWRLFTPQLLEGTSLRWPSAAEWGAVLWDPNLGLAVHAPLLALLVACALAVTVAAAPRRLAEPAIGLSLLAGGAFLLAFAQSTNMNNGGTPGLSRYGTWLVPLAIPVLQRARETASSRCRRGLAVLAVASGAWCVAGFPPAAPERYCQASRVATVVWDRWPWLDNPLPEVFAERASFAEPGLAPIATPGCTKVLLIDGQWPVPCRPVGLPPACMLTHGLCYANLVNDRYEFKRVTRPAGYTFERRRTWVWDASGGPGIDRILRRVRWRELRLAPRSAAGAMLRDADQVSWTYSLQGDRELLVYVRQPRPGAMLTMVLPGAMHGAILDAATGDEVERLRVGEGADTHTRLSIPAGKTVVVVLSAQAAGKR